MSLDLPKQLADQQGLVADHKDAGVSVELFKCGTSKPETPFPKG